MIEDRLLPYQCGSQGMNEMNGALVSGCSRWRCRSEFVHVYVLMFESSVRSQAGEALHHGVGGQGEEGSGKGGRGGEYSASTRTRRNLSSAVH